MVALSDQDSALSMQQIVASRSSMKQPQSLAKDSFKPQIQYHGPDRPTPGDPFRQ